MKLFIASEFTVTEGRRSLILSLSYQETIREKHKSEFI